MDLNVLKNALTERENIRKILKTEFKKLLTPYEIQVKNAGNKQEIKEIVDRLYNYLNEQNIDTDNTYIFMFEDYCNRISDSKQN